MGIFVALAGHVFGTRPSEMVGIQDTAKGLWMDIMLAPKALRLINEGSDVIDELLEEETKQVGMVAKGVKKNTAWMQDKLKGRT